MSPILAASEELGRVGRMTLATLTPVPIRNDDFQTMLKFARCINQLEKNAAYIEQCLSKLPETAKKNPKIASMLMGYDFHLTEDGPQLIEINNNAGGLFDVNDGWIPQCQHEEMPHNLQTRVTSMFPQTWQHIAIMDEDITSQYMYPEMQAYAKLLQEQGRQVSLGSPEDFQLQGDILYLHGMKVDAIYNRHTDFYLNDANMLPIRHAFMQNTLDLNPFPRSFALIGDKSRMVDWWRDGFLETIISAEQIDFIRHIVPETHLLAEYQAEQAWRTRKSWVFKPAARHGGKGVLMGKSITRKRFAQMDMQSTVLQKMVPPSQIEINHETFKFDVRLYMHGQQLIGLAGRAWQGQITNFREEGSGWTAIQVQDV